MEPTAKCHVSVLTDRMTWETARVLNKAELAVLNNSLVPTASVFQGEKKTIFSILFRILTFEFYLGIGNATETMIAEIIPTKPLSNAMS